MDHNDIRWRHCIDLGNGIITNGSKDTFIDLKEWNFPSEFFKNKSVLDVGACDGCFSFYAEKMGAKRVLAIDPYRWTFDDRWSGKKGFNYAHKMLNSKVESSVLSLEEISEKTIGKWDIVLFWGVFYHLPNPLNITEKLATICDDTFVIETHIDRTFQYLRFPLIRFYPNGEVNNDKTTYWGPTTHFIDSYLSRIGFVPETRLIYKKSRSITYAKKKPNYRSDFGE